MHVKGDRVQPVAAGRYLAAHIPNAELLEVEGEDHFCFTMPSWHELTTRVNDFFCGVTFPVGEQHLTLVLGGWGGAVCGLSSLDGQDAAHNETRWLMHCERDRPYQVAIRSTLERVEVRIDGELRCAVDLQGRRLSLRAEMEICRHLGFASFATRAAYWDLRWRPLP